MKKIFTILFFCGAFGFNAFAQPSNDVPCSATSLGTLPTPGPCTSGLQNGAATTLNNQSTVGATGASPYVYQTGCSGGGQQAAPALDTWYTFIASGNQVNVAISGFPNASVALWTGACNNLSAWGCMNVPAGGSGTLTAYQLVVGQQYWIEISGGNSTATDASFTLAVDNDIDCNDCMQTATLTASPAPVNGGYTAGQVVTFCFTVNGWIQQNTNWFHGVQISMGAGWTGTITNSNPANTVQNIPGPGSDGDWLYYPSGIPGFGGPGFYFDTPDAGTAADDNFGDDCDGAACSWTFCWDLTVGACTPGMNLNVVVNTTGDGESGSWSNNGCNDDNATTFSAVGVCCVPPVMTSPTTATICSGGTVNIPFTSTPVATSYTWVATANGNVTGESTTTQTTSSLINTLTNTTNSIQTVTYTVTPQGACPGAPQTVTVTVNPTPTVTAETNVTACAGSTVAANTFAGPVTGTTYAWTNSNTAIGLAASGTGGLPSFTATNGTGAPITSTITVTPTANGCPGTPITFTITVNPLITPSFAAVGPFCSGTAFTLPGTSTNGITGTWSPAINNTATTTYTFTPTAGQCAITTTMTVTINAPVTPTFTAHPAICSGGTITLPLTSTNGITGTWSPAINNTATTTYTFTPTAGQCATTTTMTVSVGAPVTPTFTAIAPICSGGSFTLPTTSNNGYTGTWSPAINNTATTTYTFTPTAGQCATTTTMTVTVNSPVTPTFTAIAPICSGDIITLPTTSTNGITGTWSPAVNNTATTMYTFTPTAGQCATTTTMTVTVNSPVTPTFVAVGPLCSGTAFALPITSTNGITGTWSPAINNTATTTYTFTPAAGQCATTTTMTVTINPQTLPTFTQVPAICSGGSFTLTTTSIEGITGTWSPAINNTTTTTYTFTPTAGQCATTTTMTVSVGAPVTPTFTAIAPICSGDLFTLPTTSNNGYTGTWSPAINNTVTTTYTFTPTAGQCATTTTMTVTVNAPVTPTFTAIAPICSGDSFTLPTTSNNGYIGTWSPAIDNTITTTYIFTPAVGQCATTTTLTVTVNPIPVADPITSISACPGDNIPASAFTSTPAGSSFVWTNTNTAIGLAASGTGNAPSFTATNASGSSISGTISVTPTLNGCPGTPVNYTITVSNQLDATITPAGPFCESAAAVTLTAVDAGGTWSGTGITNTTTGTFDPAVAGAGTFVITYTLGGSCGDVQTTNITVNPDADATINPAGPFCTSDPSVTLTSVQSGGTWSGTGITNTATGTFDPATAGAGTFTITYTIGGMCGDVQTTSVTVTNQLDATITPVGPFCESDASVNLTAVDAGGTWSGTGITNTTTGTFDPAVAGAGTFVITYTLGGSCGDVQTTNITVNPDMDATITPVGPFCTNDPALTLTAVDAGGTWSGTGITNSSLGIFDPSIAGSGTHTITYTIAGMCGDVQTTTIIVADQMDATIAPHPDVCELDMNFFFTAADPGGTWSGSGIINTSTGEFDPSVAGVGTFTITYTIGGNCGDVQTTTINVLNNANATITQAGPYCVGNSPVTLTAVDPGGTWSGTGITDPVNGIFDPAVAGVGTHAITYTIAGQCGDSRTIFIDVVANFDATITPVGPFCEDASNVDLSAVNGGGTFTGNGIIDAVNGIFDPSVAGAGTHTITYTIPGACGDIATIDIVVNPMPNVSFSVDNASGCVPLTVTFTDNSGIAGASVLWTMSDGFTSTTTGSVTHTFTSVGCFDVTLQVTSAQGCMSTQTQNDIVCVSGIPVAEFTWNPMDATIMNSTVNFTNESMGATDYVWDFAGLDTSIQTNPSFTFPGDTATTYLVCLEASNDDGCLDTVCHTIEIFDEFLVYVPNAFTPDNDGMNDVFIPVVNGYDPLSYELMVFNRWGELIFQSQHANMGWDGTYRSIMSKEDVYVWKLKVKEASNGKQHDYIGHVTLLK